MSPPDQAYEYVQVAYGEAKLAWPDAGVHLKVKYEQLSVLDFFSLSPHAYLPVPGYLTGLALTPDRETLLVLDATSVRAFDRDVKLLWQTEVAVDGVLLHDLTNDQAALSCECDPPGGWATKRLDVRTGQVLASGDAAAGS